MAKNTREFSCTKCDYAHVTITYVNGMDRLHPELGKYERLHCECKRCLFKWTEPISADPGNAAPPVAQEKLEALKKRMEGK